MQRILCEINLLPAVLWSTSGPLGTHRWSYEMSNNSIKKKLINFAKFGGIQTEKGKF